MKRCFVAAELPIEVRRRLVDLQAGLHTLPRSAARRLRLARPDAFHVTLKFLGPTDESQISALTQELTRIATIQSPVPVDLTGVGAFPHESRPHAVFVALTRGVDELRVLMADIDRACATLGFEIETRPRVPHVTLARVEGARPRGALQTWITEQRDVPLGSFVVRELVLFESELRPEGSIYTALARLPLAQR